MALLSRQRLRPRLAANLTALAAKRNRVGVLLSGGLRPWRSLAVKSFSPGGDRSKAGGVEVISRPELSLSV